MSECDKNHLHLSSGAWWYATRRASRFVFPGCADVASLYGSNAWIPAACATSAGGRWDAGWLCEVCWFTRPCFGSIPYISLHDHLIHRAGAPASLRLAVTEEVSGRFWAETDLADPGRLMVKWFEKTSGDVTPQNLKTESIIHSRRLALLSQLWRIIVGFTWVYCTAWAMMGPQPVIYHDIPMKISYHHIIIQYIILIFQSNLSIIIHLSFSIHSTGLEALESLRITSLPSRVSPPATWPSKRPKLGTVARWPRGKKTRGTRGTRWKSPKHKKCWTRHNGFIEGFRGTSCFFFNINIIG